MPPLTLQSPCLFRSDNSHRFRDGWIEFGAGMFSGIQTHSAQPIHTRLYSHTKEQQLHCQLVQTVWWGHNFNIDITKLHWTWLNIRNVYQFSQNHLVLCPETWPRQILPANWAMFLPMFLHLFSDFICNSKPKIQIFTFLMHLDSCFWTQDASDSSTPYSDPTLVLQLCSKNI